MHLTLRAKVAAIVAVVVIGIMLIFVVVRIVSFFGKKQDVRTPVEEKKEQVDAPRQEEPAFKDTSRVPFQPNKEPIALKTALEKGAFDVAAFVMPFVDRFGSYSNQSNFENLQDLLPFMTERMQTWAKEKVRDASLQPTPTIYKGTTTRSFSYKDLTVNDSAGTAEVTISTQRKDFVGTSANFTANNQDVVVELKKENGIWLIDDAQWK